MKGNGSGGEGNGGGGGEGGRVAGEGGPLEPGPAAAAGGAGGHWTRESLWSMFGDRERSGEVVAEAVEHLAGLCPFCREELAAFEAEIERQERPGAATLDAAFERVVARLPALAASAAAEKERAAAALAELAGLPEAGRADAVRARPERYRGAVLAERLLEEAQAAMPGEARRARTLLRLAREVLDHTPATQEAVELYVRVLAHLGNVHRVLEDLDGAGRLLELARDLAESHGPPPPELAAEVDHIRGALCRDQRRLPEAVLLLARAAARYRENNHPEAAARSLLTVGLTHREAGDLAAAEAVTREALTLLGPGGDRRLLRMARHNLALFLNDAGRHRAARFALHQAQGLARDDGSPWTRLRFLWLEGRIAAGLGEDEVAAGALRAVQAGFLKQGLPYDAALVSLDLAALLHRQGRHAEVRALAEEMVTVFGGKGIHREATAALLLFVRAARDQAVTAALLAELTAYLEAARHNPALPFHPPEG